MDEDNILTSFHNKDFRFIFILPMKDGKNISTMEIKMGYQIFRIWNNEQSDILKADAAGIYG